MAVMVSSSCALPYRLQMLTPSTTNVRTDVVGTFSSSKHLRLRTAAAITSGSNRGSFMAAVRLRWRGGVDGGVGVGGDAGADVDDGADDGAGDGAGVGAGGDVGDGG